MVFVCENKTKLIKTYKTVKSIFFISQMYEKKFKPQKNYATLLKLIGVPNLAGLTQFSPSPILLKKSSELLTR